MKKKVITGILIVVYCITFIILFIRLRAMSNIVLEELTDKYIYYTLGFMFIAGIAAIGYLFLSSTIAEDKDSSEEKITTNLSKPDLVNHTNDIFKKEDSDQLKAELASILELKELTKEEKTDKIVWKLCNHFDISQALLYYKEQKEAPLILKSSYAFAILENDPRLIVPGEGLLGQAVMERLPYFIKEVPEGYMKVISGLGEILPRTLLIIPCAEGNEVTAVFELSSINEYSKTTFEEITSICKYVSTLITNYRYENL